LELYESMKKASFSNEELITAVIKEQTGKLKQAYRLGIDLTFEDYRLLGEAIQAKQARSLDFLITRCKLDPNACGGEPLILAADIGCLDCVHVLCKRGANINANGGTPLFRAIKNKHFAVAEALVLKYGADASLCHSLSAFAAVANDSLDMAQLLFLKANKRSAFVNFDMYVAVCKTNSAEMFDLLERRYKAQNSGMLIRNVENRDGREIYVWETLLKHALQLESYRVAQRIANQKQIDYEIMTDKDMREILKFTTKGSSLEKNLKRILGRRSLEQLKKQKNCC
jgi:hypothetical protein